MVKYSQKTRRQKPTNCLGTFDHFVGLAFKGLTLQLFEKISLMDTTFAFLNGNVLRNNFAIDLISVS